MATSRPTGKRTTPFKDRVTWRVGAKQKSPSPSPFDSERKYRSHTSASSFGNTSPLLGNRAGYLPRRGAGEKERGGETTVGGGYRDRQRSLLQSVIRNLVDSNDEEERLAQRSKLENDLEVANERLDTLVQEHREKLHSTLRTFEAVDNKITESRDKIHRVKASLNQCKMSLRFKREELKRLWLEDIKYKNMLQTIQAIEEVRNVPDQLLHYTRRKHYLHATELLNNSVAKMEGELSDIDALKDLKTELTSQKEHLHEELIDELHRHLYVKATAKKSQAQIQSGGVQATPTDSRASPSSTKKTGTLTRRTQGHSGSASRSLTAEKIDLSAVPTSPQTGRGNSDEIVENLSQEVDPEEDSSHYMAILIESLSILGKVPEALHAIQSRMERELLLIVERASIQVQRVSDQEAGFTGQRMRGVVRENQPKLLTRLLQICFERFKNVIQAHGVLLSHLQRTRNVYKRTKFELYQEADVWAAIQRVLQTVLDIYIPFDDESSPLDGLTGLAFSTPGDTQAVFARRKVALRVTKKPLFRFESSRHAISVTSYMREQRDIELARGEEPVAHSNRHFEEEQPSLTQHLVCKPHHHNITVVFGVMREFVLEVEEALVLQPDEHCQLYISLHELVEQNFLDRVRQDTFSKMTNSTKPESAKSLASDQRTLHVTGSKQCVLNSVLSVWEVVEDLRQLVKDIPMYSAHFLSILSEVLIGYRDSLSLLYKELTSGPGEGGGAGKAGGGAVGAGQQDTIISSKWAKDDDIKRMIMSLGSWMKRQGKSRSTAAEEMQSVYAKESEILTKNIGSEPLRRNNVVLSHESLKMIAILHESMDWFNKRLKQLLFGLASQEGSLSAIHDTTDGGGISLMRGVADPGGTSYSLDDSVQNVDMMQQLSSIQSDFVNLADTTVIMLHLEVRCHCFYFLLPAVRKSSYILDSDAMQEDPNVRQLASDLKDIDLVMVAVLSQDKYQYLFEGLGHLVASIFIASTQQMRVINSNGIKKMCLNISALQSCLSKITLIREKDLDRARRYFEMLYLGFSDIIHQMMEQGPLYSQIDYVNAFKLIAQSSSPPLSEDKLREHINRLDQVFSGDTV